MTAVSAAVARLPYLGSGLGYRGEIREAIFAARDEIDFVEVITEQLVSGPRALDELRGVCEVFPVIPHGISLSVGSATGISDSYLSRIKRVSDLTASPYYSEHLCVTKAPGLDIGHLAPLALTEVVLQLTIDNVERVQETLEKPLVLENVTYLFPIAGAEMTQAEFFERLVEATGCGVLLDVTNVYINSTNHDFDPVEFIAAMPLESVVQIHLAGGYWSHDVLIDSHSEPVQEESWQLLEEVVARTPVRAAIIEHDANFPETLQPVLEQVARARTIIQARAGART
jgi:uncharacterized protein (UPF0276 family)